MNRYLVTVILLVFYATVFGQKQQKITDVAGFEQQLKRATEKIQSIESEFRQEKSMKVFSDKIVSLGTFYYHKPNKISLQYQKPIKYSATINGDKLQTISGKKKTTINLVSNKTMAQMKGLIEASMIGDISALSKDYELQYFRSATDYFVKVIPISKSVKAYVKEIEITFNRKTMELTRLRITENNDDYTNYIFTNPKYNTLKNGEKFDIR